MGGLYALTKRNCIVASGNRQTIYLPLSCRICGYQSGGYEELLAIFRHIMPYSAVEVNRSFGGLIASIFRVSQRRK
jgi:hypothetical protein